MQKSKENTLTLGQKIRELIQSITWRYKRFDRHILKPWSIMLNFWKVPNAFDDLKLATELCIEHIHDQDEYLRNSSDKIEFLLEEIIKHLMKWKGLSERDATREAHATFYDFDYIVKEGGYSERLETEGYREFITNVPGKFLTEQESEDLLDMQIDNHVTRDPIGDSDMWGHATHYLYDLKERGFYEKELYRK